jgi:hypothetical protein
MGFCPLAEQCLWAGFIPVGNDDAGKKNQSVFPNMDAALSRCLCSALTLLLPSENILRFLTAIFVFKSAVAARKQLLPWQECCATC